jgi:hypothetical protein
MNKKIIGIVSFLAVVVIGGGCGYYFGVAKPHQDAVSNFEKVVKPINEKNKALDAAIKSSEKTLNGKDQPLDSSAKKNLEALLKQAKKDKKVVPEIPKKTDEINKLSKSLSGSVDYSKVEKELADSTKNYETSIKQNKQVTNPTSDFVIERLKTISTITGEQAATESNDPNDSLIKPGSYTAAVFFTDSQVTEQIDGKDIVDKGTDAGGQVEVYKTVEDAKKRNAYLSAFDGAGMFDSGSHELCGTCVIRTSSKLNATQQKELTKQISDALTKV